MISVISFRGFSRSANKRSLVGACSGTGTLGRLPLHGRPGSIEKMNCGVTLSLKNPRPRSTGCAWSWGCFAIIDERIFRANRVRHPHRAGEIWAAFHLCGAHHALDKLSSFRGRPPLAPGGNASGPQNGRPTPVGTGVRSRQNASAAFPTRARTNVTSDIAGAAGDTHRP